MSDNYTSSFVIKNHPALQALSAKFERPSIPTEESPKPSLSQDFFSKLNISNNIELDNGQQFTIDVQPDMRNIFAYIAYNVSRDYPNYEQKGFPYVSPLSLIGYCQLIVNAHLLICDSYARTNKSYFARLFFNDQMKKDYFHAIQHLRVPKFLEEVIRQLAPALDPRRSKLEFVPSLAGVSLRHDYGRLFPPQICFAAHQAIASTRTQAEPHEVLARLYHTIILIANNVNYRIGNFLGTNYQIGNAVHTHPNWVNTIFESVFNPVVGRALTQKPTFSQIRITAPNIPAGGQFDPYEYMLIADTDNISVMTSALNGISAFVMADYPSSATLGYLLGQSTGITILNHSIEPITLPTWHALTVSANTAAPIVDTSTTFANLCHFLERPAAGTQTIPYPQNPASFAAPLYLSTGNPVNLNNVPYEFIQFDPRQHVTPNVWYFQPYDLSPSALSYTVALGIKIETSEVDGITIPTPNENSSLDENNSQYYQGSLRIDKIHPVFHDNTVPVIICTRTFTEFYSQKIGLAFRDMGHVWLPQFPTTGNTIPRPLVIPPGFTIAGDTPYFRSCFTYEAHTTDEEPPLPNGYAYIWSSYRIVPRLSPPTEANTFMILSFRPHFGLNITLSRSKNPSLMLPK